MSLWSWPLGRGVISTNEAVGNLRVLGFAFGEDFDGGEGGGGAAFDTHFLEADAEVLFGGFFAHVEDGGDVAVAFALRDPEEDFGFAGGEAEGGLEGFVGGEVGVEGGIGGFVESVADGGGFGESGLYSGEEVVADDGFGEVVVGAEVHAGADVRAVAFGGQEDEGGGGEGVFDAQGLDDAIAVEFGHHDVAENEVWLFPVGDFDADEAIFGCAGVVAFEFKHEGDVAAHGGLIFDDEDF